MFGLKQTIIRTGFEALYFSGVHKVLQPFCSGVGSILMLHHVRPARPGDFRPNQLLEITPDFLRRVVAHLKSSRVDIVSLDEMHRRIAERDFSRRFVCITFDDGYRDNKDWAYPILKDAGAPFAIYVPTSFPDRLGKLWWLTLETVIARHSSIAILLDGENRVFDCGTIEEKRAVYETLYWWLRALTSEAEILAVTDDLAARYGIDMPALCDELCMTWEEIGQLAQDPLVTIGAHTVNHLILAKASDEVARSELRMGRAVLEAALGRRPDHFAYPFGDRSTVGPREFRIAAEVGYKTAVTTRPGVVFEEHRDHMMALPRLSLNGEYQRSRYVRVLMSGAPTAIWNGFRKVDAAA